MARAFLADPEVLHKAREGRALDVRTCVACNQGCFDHVMLLQPTHARSTARQPGA